MNPFNKASPLFFFIPLLMKTLTHYYSSLFLSLFAPCFTSAAMPLREPSSSRPSVEVYESKEEPQASREISFDRPPVERKEDPQLSNIKNRPIRNSKIPLNLERQQEEASKLVEMISDGMGGASPLSVSYGVHELQKMDTLLLPNPWPLVEKLVRALEKHDSVENRLLVAKAARPLVDNTYSLNQKDRYPVEEESKDSITEIMDKLKDLVEESSDPLAYQLSFEIQRMRGAIGILSSGRSTGNKVKSIVSGTVKALITDGVGKTLAENVKKGKKKTSDYRQGNWYKEICDLKLLKEKASSKEEYLVTLEEEMLKCIQDKDWQIFYAVIELLQHVIENENGDSAITAFNKLKELASKVNSSKWHFKTAIIKSMVLLSEYGDKATSDQAHSFLEKFEATKEQEQKEVLAFLNSKDQILKMYEKQKRYILLDRISKALDTNDQDLPSQFNSLIADHKNLLQEEIGRLECQKRDCTSSASSSEEKEQENDKLVSLDQEIKKLQEWQRILEFEEHSLLPKEIRNFLHDRKEQLEEKLLPKSIREKQKEKLDRLEPSMKREINKIKQYSNNFCNYLKMLSFWEELFDKEEKKGLYMEPGWKRSENSSTEATSLQQRIEEFLINKEEKVFGLLSERGGSGKSVFAQMLEKEIWKKQIWIPIYIPLVVLEDVKKPIEEFILREIKVDLSKLYDLQQEQVLFILDGYDELPVEKRVNLYQKNNLQQWTNSKIIITSRAYAIPRSQYQQIFSPQPQEGRYYSTAYIAPFSEKSAKEYLRIFSQRYPDKMSVEWILKQYNGLAKLPIFLRFAAYEFSEAAEKKEEDELFDSTALLKGFMKSWFKQEYHKKLADTQRVFGNDAAAAEIYDAYARVLTEEMNKDGKKSFQHTIIHSLPKFPIKLHRRKQAAAPPSYWNKVFPESKDWNSVVQNRLVFRALPLQRVRDSENLFRFWHESVLNFFVSEEAEESIN